MRACDRSHAATPPLCRRMSAGSPLKQAIGTEITLVRPGGEIQWPAKRYRFFRLLSENRPSAGSEQDAAMPKCRPTTAKKIKRAATARISGRPAKPRPKLPGSRRHASVEIGEIVRKRAEAEAAIADARKSHERLREAIDILPQGIVFLDADGRYILWNRKYAEIYNRSSDLFEPGARLEDTIRIGVERGAYPAAVAREEAWIAERLAKLYRPGERHEQMLADGRCILIEERLTEDGGIMGLGGGIPRTEHARAP